MATQVFGELFELQDPLRALRAGKSCRTDVDAETEACISRLILQSESNELRLAVSEGGSEASGALRTDGTSPMLDVAEVRPGDAEAL